MFGFFTKGEMVTGWRTKRKLFKKSESQSIQPGVICNCTAGGAGERVSVDTKDKDNKDTKSTVK